MRSRLRHALHDRPLIAALLALGAILTLLLALPRLPGGAPPAVPAEVVAVADLRGHALVILDTSDGAVRRIALPGGPHELVRLADGRLVVSLEQSSRLAVVDLAREPARVESVELGGLPHGLALADGVLFVTDRSHDALRRIAVTATDPARWHELDALAAGSWPHGVVALADGELAIVSAGDSTLRIGAHAVTVSALPETVAVAAGSGDVATAGALGGGVEVFDAAGRARWSAFVGGRPVRVLFAPDGRTVAAALSAAHAVALVGADGAQRVIAVGGAPDGLAFDASGRFLFVGDLALGRVSVIDVERGEVRARFAVGESAGALLLVPRAGALPS